MVQGGRGSGGWGKRTMAVALLALAVTGWAVVGGGVGGVLADGEASAFLEATNASRQELAGAEPLVRAGDLDAVAQRHAEAMAARGKLFHNPELASQVEGWRIVAENVGVGMDVGAIHQALLDSPSHRANILDARLTQMGLGIHLDGDGSIWVVEVFRHAHGCRPGAGAGPRRGGRSGPGPPDGRAHGAVRRCRRPLGGRRSCRRGPGRRGRPSRRGGRRSRPDGRRSRGRPHRRRDRRRHRVDRSHDAGALRRPGRSHRRGCPLVDDAAGVVDRRRDDRSSPPSASPVRCGCWSSSASCAGSGPTSSG